MELPLAGVQLNLEQVSVIARKTSFGSQTDAGAKTREILMTLVHTLTLRFPDPQAHFKSVLDQLAEDPARDPICLLFPSTPVRLALDQLDDHDSRERRGGTRVSPS